MNTKSHKLILIFTFLFLIGSSPVYADNLQDGVAAYQRQDYKEAAKWYRLSAEQGTAEAQFNLGLIYANGRGVPQDHKEAVKWYRLSTKQGTAEAQYNLGLMYAKGRGVPQDYVLTHMWFNIAGSNGMKDAIKNRAIVEKRMTQQQIEKAQEMARNWKPTTN